MEQLIDGERNQEIRTQEREWFIERCDFSEPGYVQFILNLAENGNTYRLHGMYRIHDPQEGPDHKLAFFNSDGQTHTSLYQNWDAIEKELTRTVMQMENQQSIADKQESVKHSLAPEYIEAMNAAGYELITVEDFCFFRERQTGDEIGLDFESGIYDYLQKAELSSEVRNRVEVILPKTEWSITEYGIDTPGRIKFVFDLKEDDKVIRLNGVYDLYEPKSGEPDQKLVFLDEGHLEHKVINRDWDKIESRLREIGREIQHLQTLAAQLKEAEELTGDDQNRIDRLFESKRPEMKVDLTGQKFYDVRFSGNLEHVNFSDCSFKQCRFYDANMQSTDFTRSVINAEFRDCIIKKCQFDHAGIVQSSFSATEIRECNFTEAVLKGGTIRENCHLLYNDFLRTSIDDTRFHNREIYPQKNVDTIRFTMEQVNREENDTYREFIYKEYTQERLNGPVCLDRYRYEVPYEDALMKTNQVLAGNSLTETLSEDVKEFLLDYVVRGGSIEEMERFAKAAGAQGGKLTEEQQSQAAQTANQIRLENWKAAGEIAADIEKSGFTPTWNLVHNVHELRTLTGKSYTLQEVAEAAKNKDQSLFRDNAKAESCIGHIASECRYQELEKEANGMEKGRQAEELAREVPAMDMYRESLLPEL